MTFRPAAVISTSDRGAGLTPTVAKASAGASEFIPFIGVTNLSRSLELLKEEKCWIVGAALDDTAASLFTAELPERAVIVLGSEGSGIRELTAKRCDMLVKIPTSGNVQSLSVSQAAAILGFEWLRQSHLGEANS